MKAVSLVVAEAARKPVVIQRLTVVPLLFFAMKFASRSCFIRVRDAIDRLVPGDGLELVRAGLADHRVFRARRRLHEVEQRCALRAERAAVDRMVGIALDVDELGCAPSSRSPMEYMMMPQVTEQYGQVLRVSVVLRELERPDGLRQCFLGSCKAESPRRSPRPPQLQTVS